MNTGWEIRPLGWLLLVLLIGIAFYYAITKLMPPTKDDPPKY
jgi:hypothetical protein